MQIVFHQRLGLDEVGLRMWFIVQAQPQQFANGVRLPKAGVTATAAMSSV